MSKKRGKQFGKTPLIAISILTVLALGGLGLLFFGNDDSVSGLAVSANAPPKKGQGGWCWDDNECQMGLVCAGDGQGVCAKPCGRDGDCNSTQYCTNDGFCNNKRNQNALCSVDKQCKSGLTCRDAPGSSYYSDGRLITFKHCSKPCLKNNNVNKQCDNGYYCLKKEYCTKKGGIYSLCSQNIQCTSGICNRDGKCGCVKNSDCSGDDTCLSNKCYTMKYTYEPGPNYNAFCSSGDSNEPFGDSEERDSHSKEWYWLEAFGAGGTSAEDVCINSITLLEYSCQSDSDIGDIIEGTLVKCGKLEECKNGACVSRLAKD